MWQEDPFAAAHNSKFSFAQDACPNGRMERPPGLDLMQRQ
jgi:hypothetical protein